MSIDENKNIRLVSDDILTYMYSGLENGYDKSFVNKWLNSSEEKYSGIFENILYDKDNILVNSDLCTDVVDDLNNILGDNVSFQGGLKSVDTLLNNEVRYNSLIKKNPEIANEVLELNKQEAMKRYNYYKKLNITLQDPTR